MMKRQVRLRQRKREGGFAALIAAVLALGLLHGASGAAAQDAVESFEIGLSTDTIAISSDFTGARLVVFGALDNADARLLRQQRYDIVVVLVGPRRPVVVRQKERTLGVWVNRGSETFNSVPGSYALAATRPLSDITRREFRRRLSLGIQDIRLNSAAAPAPAGQPTIDKPGVAEQPRAPSLVTETEPGSAGDEPPVQSLEPDETDVYAAALRRLRERSGLFNQSVGSVEFVSPTLFRADLQLPAGLPTGQHLARAYLFKSGVFIRESSEPLWVVKTGFESMISDFATHYAVIYGFAAVALAIFTGWFGRVVFKRD